MDLAGKVVMGLFVVWAGAMAVGLLIAALPVIVAVIGFALTITLVGFVANLVVGWLFY